jgi:hypothetical protein
MWVRQATIQSLEHAVFPLLQMSICLSSAELLDDFGCGLSDADHHAMRASICQTHISAAYTVLTDALFRRIPTLSQYLASWLVTHPMTTGPMALWMAGHTNTRPYPCHCLAHTYDPTGHVGYSVRCCSQAVDYVAWLEQLSASVDGFATEAQDDMSCLEHVLVHTDAVVQVHRQKHLRSRDHPAIGDPLVWLDDPRGPPEPSEPPEEQGVEDFSPGPPAEQGPIQDLVPEGYEDIDFGALSDMELSPPHPPPKSPQANADSADV